jgi:hypothetical protein
MRADDTLNGHEREFGGRQRRADHRFPGGNDAALVTLVAGRIGGIEPQVVAA